MLEGNLRIVVVEWCVSSGYVVRRVDDAVLLEEILDLIAHVHLEYAILVAHVDAEERRYRIPIGDLVGGDELLAKCLNGVGVRAGDDEIIDFTGDKDEALARDLVEQTAVAYSLRVTELVGEEVRQSLVPKLRSVS